MTKTTRLLTLIATTALLGVSTPVLAEQIQFTASLTGTAETPPNDSPGNGTADVTYDTDTNLLTYSITYGNLTGDPSAAHFHGPAGVGEKAPPVVPISGNLASPIRGTATISDEQEAELEAGKWYVNLHTAKYPDGEIRGQLTQVGGTSSMAGDASSSSMAADDGASSSMADGGSSSAADGGSSSAASNGSSSSAASNGSSSNASSAGADASVSASVEVSASGDVSVSVNPSSVGVSTSVDASVSTDVSVSASAP